MKEWEEESVYILNKFFCFVIKLDAALSTHQSSSDTGRIPIPHRSRCFVQLPGDHVLEGFLRNRRRTPLPSWVYPPHHEGDNSQPNVLIRRPFYGDMLGHLRTLHNYHNNNVQTFRIFVKISNNSILSAFLTPSNDTLLDLQEPRAFVRLPAPYNAIYSGALRFRDGWRPEWL